MHLTTTILAASAVTSTEVLIPALTEIAYWLIGAVAGLWFYAIVTNRAVFEHLGKVRSELFDRWDALLASLIGGFFLFVIFLSARTPQPDEESAMPSGSVIVVNMFLYASIFLLIISGVLAALRLRGISRNEVFGFNRVKILPILGWAVLLLSLAYPLIQVSAGISELLLQAVGSREVDKQQLVNFFIDSPPSIAKWFAAIFAVVVAPAQEEFLFRGYIYGVVRRYGGVPVGILFNATLFAAIHLHLPSFAPLFVLAVCLSLAYEWTGSLWVPMCMHAMFNSITLLSILFEKTNG